MLYIVMSPVRNGYYEGERFHSDEPIAEVMLGFTGTYEYSESEYIGSDAYAPAYFVYLDDNSEYADWSYDPYGD